MTPATVTVLDCTLRDGGYYTNWEFDRELVWAYLTVCGQVGVDVVELGYLRFANCERGPYGALPAGLDPELFDHFAPGRKPRLAVMVDAADAAGRDQSAVGSDVRARVDASPLRSTELIRVAVRYDQLSDAVTMMDSLRQAGFQVCVNLMQIGLASRDEVSRCLDVLCELGPLAAVYLADSLGSIGPGQARVLAARFRAALRAPIGFHAHDNQGLALANTLAVLNSGVTWVDTTMGGMGRGAGNAKTEQLLAHLAPVPTDLGPLDMFVARFVNPLLDKHRWGANVYYAMAGRMSIHPTYVQRLEEDATVDVARKLNVLRTLAAAGARTFSSTLMQDVLDNV